MFSEQILKKYSIPAIIIIALLYISLLIFSPTLLLTCEDSPYTYNRNNNPDKLGNAFIPSSIRNFLFIWITRILLISNGVYCYWVVPNKLKNIFAFGYTFVIVGGYYVAEYIVEYVKRNVLEDKSCSEHGNGISGHLFFIMWSLLIYSYLNEIGDHFNKLPREEKEKEGEGNKRIVQIQKLVGQPLLIINLLSQGTVTYIYGYGSIQQILYGALLGVVFATITMISMDNILFSVPQQIELSTPKKKEE